MLLIKNANIYTMNENNEVLKDYDILIKDGKFSKIESNIKLDNRNVEIIDTCGFDVYPGLIDAHSHIGISEEKTGVSGDDCNESSNPITPNLRAIDAINPMDSAFHSAIAVGITTVMVGPGSANIIGGQFACIKTDGRCIDDMIIKAPAAMKIAFGENPKTSYGNNGNMPVTRMAIASMLRDELQKANDYYLAKQKGDDNFKIDYNYESYLPLFSHDIPLKAHAHRLDDIFTAIRIAKEFNLLLTIDHCTEGYLGEEEIAKSGFPAIVGPSLASRSKIEVENSDFKTPGILKRAGAKVAITTDHPVTRIQYLPLCAGLAVKEGMDRNDALRSITIDAAAIIGVQDRVGSIEIGKDADLVIYDGDPLEISGSAVCTIINGKITFNKIAETKN